MRRIYSAFYVRLFLLGVVFVPARFSSEVRHDLHSTNVKELREFLKELKNERIRNKREIYVTFQDRAMATCIGMCMYQEQATYFQCEARCRIGAPLDPSYVLSEEWKEAVGHNDRDISRDIPRDVPRDVTKDRDVTRDIPRDAENHDARHSQLTDKHQMSVNSRLRDDDVTRRHGNSDVNRRRLDGDVERIRHIDDADRRRHNSRDHGVRQSDSGNRRRLDDVTHDVI